ncbi:MAG: DUF5320 domain-containing protein [Candidatus Moranbacteria bacterium]|nr:DUF5320 domain-containing protein [Candidatus Moranbacteria bacterium]
MPRRDKTGPMGEGPMTGRGQGFCEGAYGPGLGMGRGYGRVMCGWFYRKYNAMNKDDKRELLKEEIEDLKQELKMVEDEIKELDKE